MKHLIVLIILCGCSARSALILEDLIDGEVKVIEHVVEDVGGIPHPQSAVQISTK